MPTEDVSDVLETLDGESPLDFLSSDPVVTPKKRGRKTRTTKTEIPGGGEVKVSIKTPSVVQEEEPVVQRKKRSRPRALDLLSEGSNEHIFVRRVGPKKWRDRPVQVADCGYIPGDSEDIHTAIKDKWGGGEYQVRGRDSAGDLQDVRVRIAGKPLPIDEEAAAEEEAASYEEEPGYDDREEAMARRMGRQQGYDYTGRLGPDTPGYGYYNPYGRGAAREEDDEEKKRLEDDRRQLQERLDRMESDSRSREREMLMMNQQKSEAFMGEQLKMQAMAHQQDQSRWERDFKERQLQQQAEQKQRDQQWREQQQRWEREQTERGRERDERERRNGEQMNEERRRLESEQKRWEQQRKEDQDRQREDATAAQSRSEQQVREQREFYERLSKVQEHNNSNSGKVLETVRGFLDIAQQAREMVTEPDDPKVAQIKAVQEAVSAGLSAAKPVMAAMRGQPLETEPVPMQAPQRLPEPIPGVSAPIPAPPAATTPTPVMDEVQAKVRELAALLQRFAKAIKGKDGQSDPPEWSVGRIQDMPDILEELRGTETPEALLMRLELVRAGGQLAPDIDVALGEFLEAGATDQGREWIGQLLAKIA